VFGERRQTRRRALKDSPKPTGAIGERVEMRELPMSRQPLAVRAMYIVRKLAEVKPVPGMGETVIRSMSMPDPGLSQDDQSIQAGVIEEAARLFGWDRPLDEQLREIQEQTQSSDSSPN
jgi:hypothetical protein